MPFSIAQLLNDRHRREQDFKRERRNVQNVRHRPPHQLLLQQKHPSTGPGQALIDLVDSGVSKLPPVIQAGC